MSTYKYVSKFWKERKDDFKQLRIDRLIQWRREPTVLRIENPTRIDRARALGYRRKKGFILARVRVPRGGRRKPRPNSGRRSKRMGVTRLTSRKSRQWIAEERCSRRYVNLEILNSYPVLDDGRHRWFEVIMIDPQAPEIISDPKINWICQGNQKNRVLRGKTSAGRKSRGLQRKGKGSEHTRPSYDR
ncbi:MAG: 50S ribosomal protein L15e [Candidatus Heimdallarchaeota archaeon]|nr:50S ribosomal protein L15e [Candidatus Heimdallarchaeota archaeon]